MSSKMMLHLIAFFAWSTVAAAEIPNIKGGSAFLARLGPWHVSSTYYSDGARVCWAYNFAGSRDLPAFSLNRAVKHKKLLSSRFRFSSDRSASPGATVSVQIAGKTFQLLHTQEMPKNVFTTQSPMQMEEIYSALSTAESSGKRSFVVKDESGRSFKFSSEATKKMREFLTSQCATK